MGAEINAQVEDSPVTQIRKPDKVEALDVALLDVSMKENPDFSSPINSPDSVLSVRLKENAGAVSKESAAGIDNADPAGLSTSATVEADKAAGVEETPEEATEVAAPEELPPTAGITNEEAPVLDASILAVETSVAEASIAHEIQEMEEISLEEEGVHKGSAPESNPTSSVPESRVEPELTRSASDLKAAEDDALVTAAAPGFKLEIITSREGAEVEEKLPSLAATASGSLPTTKSARASEIQEAPEPATPPTPERTGAVIRLTRQMSRVSTGMGPMSPRFEVRAAKEINELQEKVKLMEEELRRKCAVIETLGFNHKERELELLKQIECLELANEQLLQGGNDSSIQLQMELTRLQRQNSVLQLRERELQFQINTQEMMKTQMLDKRPAAAEVNPVEQLESKVAVLESKLAEAVEVSNMYKIQLHEAFSRQKSAQSAALLNLGDAGEVIKELQKLRKQTKEQETELVELQDRFFMISVRLAETAAHKEELLSKLKRVQGLR